MESAYRGGLLMRFSLIEGVTSIAEGEGYVMPCWGDCCGVGTLRQSNSVQGDCCWMGKW